MGRARLENRHQTLEALKPWVAAGMSRASWYRRRREVREDRRIRGDKSISPELEALVRKQGPVKDR